MTPLEALNTDTHSIVEIIIYRLPTTASEEVSLRRNGQSNGLRNRKRVRTPVALLRSLSDKYHWELYEPPYTPDYRRKK